MEVEVEEQEEEEGEGESSVTLLASTDYDKFDVNIAAPNTALNLDIPSVPPGTKLHLRSATTEKFSVVSLPSQYTGKFHLANSGLNALAPAVVHHPWDLSDSRQSVVDWSIQGDPEEGSSHIPLSTLVSTVDVVTRNSQNTLILKLESIKNQIRAYKAQISELKRQREAGLIEITSCRNILSPIRWVPLEIPSEVFASSPSDSSSSELDSKSTSSASGSVYDAFKRASTSNLCQDDSDSRPGSPPPLYRSRPSSLNLTEAQTLADDHPKGRRLRKLFKLLRLSFFVLLLAGLVFMVIFYYVQLRAWKQSDRFHRELIELYRPSRHNLVASNMFTELGALCLKNATWHGETLQNLNVHDSFFYADTSFEVPLLDLASFMLLSRGPRMAGRVRIIDSAILENVAKVHLRLNSSYAHRTSDSVRVCVIETPDHSNTTGIGFSTNIPPHTSIHSNFFLDVTVILPSSGNGKRLDLEVDLPTFTQEFDTEDLIFRDVNIVTGEPVLAVSALNAHTMSVKTFDAPIKGVFNVFQSLALQTTNSYIDANVTLQNWDHKIPARLDLSNLNSEIRSSVTLLTSTDHAKFDVNVAAPNTTLNLDIPSVPPGTELHLRSATTEKSSVVSLPSQYTGNFYLATFGLNALVPAVLHHPWDLLDSRQSVVDWSIQGDPEQGRVVLEGCRDKEFAEYVDIGALLRHTTSQARIEEQIWLESSDISFFLNGVSESKTQLEKTKGQIRAYEARISELKRQRDAELVDIASCRNILSPIRQVPLEILLEIFHFFVFRTIAFGIAATISP
ncbi:hypothetical protein BT96DRAFT_1013332 [Gymnopus androsaceus JB14]|uniref:Uncharacterized protein n=1 Tax=Gymnopus androsaceus JB14 TaxID=1447944 RepID=A0A6A4IJJ8_9AGAR|nr:hypothetical protein BT96DRAFT_1013332 [Gymnopus androsaceus JB14]